MDNFIQADIYTASQAIDGITGALTDYGITGFIISDSADFESFLADKNANWDYVDDELMGLSKVEPHITLYVHDNYYGNLRMELANVKEEDWANNWKKYYKPFRVGKTLVVKPSWEEVTPAAGDRILEIDPASTFGTGQHHTTKLVMEALEDIVKPGAKVLDLGCGSGILSIASLLFGAEKVTMCDIFENAVKTASENVEKNNFTHEHYTAYCGNIIDDAELRSKLGTGYDVVCANIVADVIIGMSPLFAGFMKPDATLIVSGIIDERLDEVNAALTENGFVIADSRSEEGWNCIILHR